jgi:sterol desaturase/sphingolipid hydroxylase (fatty acid hydroxylase superfamily)
MTEFVSSNEAAIRIAFFLGIFSAVGIAEMIVPRRRLTTSKRGRWFANIGIIAVNTVFIRLFFSAGAVGIAVLVSDRNWGILNNLSAPYWLAVILSVLFLDFVIYLQHVMFHAVPTLWRLHMMHHADMDIDVTTGTRFHPVEMFLSMLIKAAAIIVSGAPPLAVIIFEVLLNGTAMFNHGNIKLPIGLDAILRLFVVTPDMHRVHHSVLPIETNSNYGFNLPWWDRLMGTYRSQPLNGHTDMTIGLKQFRNPDRLGLMDILMMPFRAPQGSYAINRRGQSGL